MIRKNFFLLVLSILSLSASCSKEEIVEKEFSTEPKVCEGKRIILQPSDVYTVKYCTVVKGDLEIGDDSNYLGAVSLKELSSLRRIEGNLVIRHRNLVSLEGLDNLEYVGGNILIIAPNLQDIRLSSLETVGGAIEIEGINRLTSIDDFISLKKVSEVIIKKNPSLESISSFNGITDLDVLMVDYNLSLTEVEGFRNLETARRLVHLSFNAIKFNGNFNSLREVGEGVGVTYNTDTGKMDAFNNLVKAKRVGVSGSDANEISGFRKLQEVQNIGFSSNNSPVISGFDELTRIGEHLSIFMNPGLEKFSPFPDLKEIKGDFKIYYNDRLQSVEAFNSVESIGGELLIKKNGLNEIVVGDQMRIIEGDINVINNPSLISIEGLNGLQSEGKMILIYDHPLLESVSGFNGITTTRFLQIWSNFKLSSFEAFKNLRQISEILSLSGNSQLEKVYLESLELVGNIMTVGGNKLQNLQGFSKLTTIGEVLEVVYEPEIQNLNGLDNVTSQLEYLRISNNPELTDIRGIRNISGVRDYVYIGANFKLSVCHNDFVCSVIASGSTFELMYNLPGCETVEEVRALCTE